MDTEESRRREKLEKYLSRVAELFAKVREWVALFDPEAEVSDEIIAIKEEAVGTYEAPALVISRREFKTIRLEPKGCWIIGAQGRVDMISDLGTETLVYALDGGPAIQFKLLTENGKVLEEGKPRQFFKDVSEGWALVQNRQLGLLPQLDAELFRRLLEVLGR